MKKKLLSIAVVAGLATAAVSAQAEMHLNANGTGEALIFPFYSAEAGNATLVNIVNTTDQFKAVKVRFIEGMNSQEVLDFNLYLSPEDHWSGSIFFDPAYGNGAVVRTRDTSCTVPALGTPAAPGFPQFNGTTVTLENGMVERTQPFVNYAYNKAGENNRTIERTREGYIEVIEMGVIDPTSRYAPAIKHTPAGVPGNCNLLVEAWSVIPGNATAGRWLADETDGFIPSSEAEFGGIYGYASVINVARGTNASYDATAIDGFIDPVLGGLHSEPGNELPSLAEAQPFATIFNGTQAIDLEFANGQDAVSALLMKSAIMNDYVLDPDLNATTDWVITMPTKRFYVNGAAAVAPFTNRWNGSTACEAIDIAHWDREEAVTQPEGSTPIFSPRPPQVDNTQTFSLCTEVSILTMASESAIGASNRIRYGFAPEYQDGWMRVSFDGVATRELTSEEGVVLRGLPVVGFAVQNYQNGNVGGAGVLGNFSAVVTHKAEVDILTP